jgi:hypothetical protein
MKKIMLGFIAAVVLIVFLVPDEYINLAKFLRYYKLSEGCISIEEERKMKAKTISREEQEAIARKTFTCIKNKQSFIERSILPVPEDWLSTSHDDMSTSKAQ